MFASEIRKRRVHHRSFSHWRWHLDEVFVRINGETHYLWRAVDHEGEVLEVLRALRRDRRAALKFLKRTMKRYGRPRSIVTDRLRSYRAAMKVIDNVTSQECGLVLNFVPDKERALQEMRRIVEPGGTVAAYVWDYAGEMQLIRYFWDAVGELFPDAAAHDEGKQLPICNPESLAGLFSAAGLQEVETCALDAPTVC